jgi:hypothetical protein
MSFLDKLFSGGAGTLVDSVGNAIDKLTTTKEEKLQLELEIKKAEMQFQVDMQKLSNEERQMVYQDVSSARTMATAVQTSASSTKLSKNTTAYMAIGTTVLTFALFFVLIFFSKNIPPESKDIVLYILGVLSAILTQVFSFYFGSSMGSSDKNKIIENMHDQSMANK